MIIVIGATGQTGAALVAGLRARGLRFKALAHSQDSYERLKAEKIEAVLADEAQAGSLTVAMDGAERMFLLTPSTPGQAEVEARLVEAAKQAGVRHVVKQSVLGVDDVTGSFPSVSLLKGHGDSEKFIRQSGIGYTFLRPNAFMQNLGNMSAAQIKTQSLIANSVGEGRVSYIDMRDIAAVAVEALSDDKHIGQVYELTGPQSLTYAEIAKMLTKVVNRTVSYKPMSDEDYRAALLGAGLPAARAEGLSALYRSYREGKAAQVTDVIERVTGQPARCFEDYLAENKARFE